MPELIVIGGGEHSRVVIEAVRSHPEPWRIIGFVDPLPCRETVERMQVERLGGNDAVAKFPDAGFVLGLGLSGRDGQRRQLVERLAAPDARWATVIHHAAWVSPTSDIGAGTVVLAGAVVNCGAKIGRHCIVNSRACIEHDATLGDFVHAAPGSIVAGGAAVGADSFLGIGSLVRDQRSIGRNCLVGMGAAVTRNFGDNVTLLGVPARAGDRDTG